MAAGRIGRHAGSARCRLDRLTCSGCNVFSIAPSCCTQQAGARGWVRRPALHHAGRCSWKQRQQDGQQQLHCIWVARQSIGVGLLIKQVCRQQLHELMHRVLKLPRALRHAE